MPETEFSELSDFKTQTYERGKTFMNIAERLYKENSAKTVDYFIRTKVDDLIERSVQEGKKREQIANEVSDACADPNTDVGTDFIGSIADFSDFPKYAGRGVQESAPDLNGSMPKSGEATLTMWFTEVEEAEVKDYIEKILASGFKRVKNDFIKEDSKAVYTMSVSFSAGRLRIFHMIQKKF